MSDATNLATIKSQIIARLVEITASPKPSYMVDGQSVQWSAYFNALTSKLTEINALIAAESPVEVTSQGFVPDP